MTPEALRHLRRADPVLGAAMKRIGPCRLEPDGKRTPFESLVRAVAHQQLHGRAAECILGRLCAPYPGGRYPKPAELLALSEEQMRAIGFSTAKTRSLRDIAEKAELGIVPSGRVIRRLSDEEIITRLTSVRGVGRWTVEMLLIFQLGRPDVLPVDDFGVRQGCKVLFGLEEMPRPKELLATGERWAPFRTTAAWYLWRVADAAKGVKEPAGGGKPEGPGT